MALAGLTEVLTFPSLLQDDTGLSRVPQWPQRGQGTRPASVPLSEGMAEAAHPSRGSGQVNMPPGVRKRPPPGQGRPPAPRVLRGTSRFRNGSTSGG